jgi:lytic cellulose monooxygenase (C1-hydroxylating)
MSVLALLAFATTALAHGHVSSYTVGGQVIQGGTNGALSVNPRPNTPAWLAANNDNGFVTDVTSPDVICHKSAEPGSSSFTVTAGDTITLQWNTWPDSHSGPVIDYLAPVNGDFESISKSSLLFTKIAEAGLSGGKWAANELIANGFKWQTTIPSSIAPGNYVLRHEILALHEAQRVGGTQFYPQCINIEVTGSGTNDLSDGTPGTQLYGQTEPGVIFDMYNGATSYPIPGPAVMAGGSTGGGSGGGSPPATTATATSAAPTVAVPTTTLRTLTTTAAPAPTGGSGSGTVPKWQQCGGQEYTGPTSCVSGTTCQQLNPYYFQCL